MGKITKEEKIEWVHISTYFDPTGDEEEDKYVEVYYSPVDELVTLRNSEKNDIYAIDPYDLEDFIFSLTTMKNTLNKIGVSTKN